MTEWKKYDGTDEQIAEMRPGFIFKDGNAEECNKIYTASMFVSNEHIKNHLKNCGVTHYLVTNPHPLADMISQQAQTGQPVWIRIPRDMHFDGLYQGKKGDIGRLINFYFRR